MCFHPSLITLICLPIIKKGITLYQTITYNLLKVTELHYEKIFRFFVERHMFANILTLTIILPA